MKDVISMAGKYASHAIWSVSDGETLLPILGFIQTDGRDHMERLVMGSAEAMATGDKKLNNLDENHRGVAFIKDAVVTFQSGKTDCLIVDIRFSDDSTKKVQFLIPYRNANHDQGFAVHRLKISEVEGFSMDDASWISEAFFEGLESHPEGGKIWNTQYVDQAGSSAGYYGQENTEFSAEDFDKLKQAPFLIFFMVAAADGNVDKKEAMAFMKILSNPDILQNPLLNRIVTNIINDIPQIISDMATQQIDYLEELAILQTIVDGHLGDEDANQFKIALFLVGKKIAEASGGFLGFGSKVSKEEKAALTAIALCLGLKP